MKKILLTSITALAIVGTANAQLNETVGNSKFFNENDGGGIMYDNNGKKSFVGVNDGKDDIDVQLYSLDENKNGSRLNVTDHGIYYAVGNTKFIMSPENELATKGFVSHELDKLEKNISGGVAAATALSSVEVSNVEQGEMSVGGGYGYYNGESAGAFGAALGLTNDWSVNAGAGIATGDKTQVSFRAGTNYKFKLF